MGITRFFLILLSLILGAEGFAQDKGLSAKEVASQLAVVRKQYFSNPTMDQLYVALGKLSAIKNATTWIKNHPNDPTTLAFKEFQLSLKEVARAEQLINQCTKGEEILKRKATGMISKIASMNRGQSALGGSCTVKDKNEALMEMDQETLILYQDHQNAENSGAINFSKMAPGTERGLKEFVYSNQVQARSDFLGTKAVFQDARMRSNFGKAQEAKIQSEVSIAKKSRMWIDTHESGVETDDYIKKKYGFDLKDNERSEEAKKRAKRLHQELMDANRKNSLRNYLYFSQRFAFSGEPNFSASDGKSAADYRGLEKKALELFGNAQHLTPGAGLTRNLPEYEEQALARFGQDTIKKMEKAYAGHYRMDESMVLAMLAPVLKELNVSVAEDQKAVQELKNEKLDRHTDAGLAAPQQKLNREAQMSVISGINDKALKRAQEKNKSTEVGFILHTEAFKKFIGKTANSSPEEKMKMARQMIRESVREMIDDTKKYAGWVDKHQSTQSFWSDDKGVWDYSKATELMMYSSPQAIQGVISKNPQLLGSMCFPMKEAAKKRDMSPPAWVNWGGGLMAAVPGPAGTIASGIFGVTTAAITTAIHNSKSKALREQKEHVGLGDYVLERDWEEAKLDKAELKTVINKHEEEIVNGLVYEVAGQLGGRVISKRMEAAGRYNAATKKITTEITIPNEVREGIKKEMRDLTLSAERALKGKRKLTADEMVDLYRVQVSKSKLPIKQQLMDAGFYEDEAEAIVNAGVFKSKGPSATTWVAKDKTTIRKTNGILGLGEEKIRIDPQSKPIPYSDPKKIQTQKGAYIGKAADGSEVQHGVEFVVPDEGTAIGKYSKSLDKKNTKVVLDDDEFKKSSARGYATTGLAFKNENGLVTNGSAAVFPKKNLNTKLGAVVRQHEGFHVRMISRRENGVPSPYHSSLNVTSSSGPSLTSGGSYSDFMHSEELHAFGKDMINRSLVAHNRETVKAIEASMKLLPSSLSKTEKLARTQIKFKSVINRHAFNEEYKTFSDIANGQRDNLFVFSERIDKYRKGDPSALKIEISKKDKGFVLAVDDIELKFGGVPVENLSSVSTALEFADEHIKNLFRINQQASKSAADLSSFINKANKQGYFTGTQYYELKDKMAKLSIDLDVNGRLPAAQRFEGYVVPTAASAKTKIAETTTAVGTPLTQKNVLNFETKRLVDRTKPETVINVKNGEYHIVAKSKEIPVSDPEKIFSEQRKILEIDELPDGSTFSRELNAELVIPDKDTNLGRFAAAIEAKNGTKLYIADDMNEGGYLTESITSVVEGGPAITGRAIVVSRKNINEFYGQISLGHEGFHDQMQKWRTVGKDSPFHSRFSTIGDQKLEKPAGIYSNWLHSEEAHAYTKDLIQYSVVAENKSTVQAIEKSLKNLPRSFSRTEKLKKIKIEFESVISPKQFEASKGNLADIVSSETANLDLFSRKIKSFKNGDPSALTVRSNAASREITLEADGIEFTVMSVPAGAFGNQDKMIEYARQHIEKLMGINKKISTAVEDLDFLVLKAKKQGHFNGNQYFELKDKMAKLSNEVDVNRKWASAVSIEKAAQPKVTRKVEWKSGEYGNLPRRDQQEFRTIYENDAFLDQPANQYIEFYKRGSDGGKTFAKVKSFKGDRLEIETLDGETLLMSSDELSEAAISKDGWKYFEETSGRDGKVAASRIQVRNSQNAPSFRPTFDAKSIAKTIEEKKLPLIRVEEQSVSQVQIPGADDTYIVRSNYLKKLPDDNGIKKHGFDLTTRPKREVQFYKLSKYIGVESVSETQLANVYGQEVTIQRKFVGGIEFKSLSDYSQYMKKAIGSDPAKMLQHKIDLENMAMVDIVGGNMDRNVTNIIYNPKTNRISLLIDNPDCFPVVDKNPGFLWFWQSPRFNLDQPLEAATRTKILALNPERLAQTVENDALVEAAAIVQMKNRIIFMQNFLKANPKASMEQLANAIEKNFVSIHIISGQ